MSRSPRHSAAEANGSPPSRLGSAVLLHDERQQPSYPPAGPAGESAPVRQRIAATAEEGSAERAAAPPKEESRQLAAPAAPDAEATPEPPGEEAAPAPVTTSGGRLLAIAEAAVLRARPENRPGARPQPPAPAQRSDSLRDRALARAAVAPSREERDLPLWTGNDLPTGSWSKEGGILHDAYGVPQWRLKTFPAPTSGTQPSAKGPAGPGADTYEPVDLRQAFTSTVAKAWADTVPPEHGTVDDLLEAVDVPLRELEEQWRQAVPTPRADGERQTAPARTGHDGPAPSRRDPEPVDVALRQADTHAAALRDFPEWQRLQTVRGATTHLWNMLRERAGEYFGRLRTDLRVQGFWRTVSLRTATAIGSCALALADRVHRGLRGGDLPTAEALLRLGDAALTYSTPGIPRPDHPASDTAVGGNVSEVRQLHTTLRTGAPVPYWTQGEATHVSREVAEAFQTWRETPMGRELTATSEHPRVAAFRQAWQRLPAADLPDGPGTAAGPYGDVGRSAHTLVERAEAANAQRAMAGQPARFATADVDALRAVATLAEHHGGRLAVTLPPGLTGHAARRSAGPQAAASSPEAIAPTTSVAWSRRQHVRRLCFDAGSDHGQGSGPSP
ncbi:hypothetical protein ACH4MG_34295 [Streptomyces sp. NPDC017454]|uniref:hypothetical protein n=1 Tax=Streptomyces sp. NPDC017454 TaxID=3364997 RepID=UPI003795ED10